MSCSIYESLLQLNWSERKYSRALFWPLFYFPSKRSAAFVLIVSSVFNVPFSNERVRYYKSFLAKACSRLLLFFLPRFHFCAHRFYVEAYFRHWEFGGADPCLLGGRIKYSYYNLIQLSPSHLQFSFFAELLIRSLAKLKYFSLCSSNLSQQFQETVCTSIKKPKML